MILDVLICTIYIFLFTYIVWKSAFFNVLSIPKHYFLVVFLLKITIGIALWQLYIFFYPINDSIVFFKSSKVFSELFFQNSEQFFKLFFGHEDASLDLYSSELKGWKNGYSTFGLNDSRTIIRYNTILQFFSFGTYHVHTIISCFLSFIGLTCIYKALLFFVKEKSKVLFLVIFLLPSVLFWSSILSKESLIFLGLGMVLYHSRVGLKKSYSLLSAFYLVLGFLLMFLIKPYLLFCILPALFANAIFIRLKKKRGIVLVYLSLFSILFLLMIGVHSFLPKYDLIQKLKDKQELFNKSARGGVYLKANNYYIFVDYNQRHEKLFLLSDSTCRLNRNFTFKKFRINSADSILLEKEDYSYIYQIPYDSPPAGSYYQIDVLNGSIWQMIALIPKKIADMFLLTDFFKHKGFLVCFALLENYVMLLVLFLSFCFCDFRKDYLPILLFCVCFVASLYIVIGFTTPVLGAIVRYKVPAGPFLGIIMVLLYSPKKLKAFFSRFSLQNR